MRKGVAFSVGVHALILLLIIFGLPFLRPKPVDPPPMIQVEVIDTAKETTTNRVSTVDKVEKEVHEEAPTPPAPPPPSEQPQPTPRPPEPEPKPQLDETAPQLAAVEDTVPELKTPDVDLKPRLEEAPELSPVAAKVSDLAPPSKVDLKRPEPKKPPESFDNLLKNLTKQKLPDTPLQPVREAAKEPAKPASGAQAPVSANLTASELSALSQQLARCWSLPAGVKDAQNLIVDLDVTINPDRTVAAAKVVDQGRMASDPAFAVAARAAQRALRMPQCTPLMLPPEKYQEWQSMTIHFDPKEMLGQ